MRLLNIPFVIITFSTISGIILGYYLSIKITTVLLSFFVSIIVLGISWHRSKKMFSRAIDFVPATIIVFIVFGTTLVNIYNPKNNPNHYINHFSKKDLQQNSFGIQFHIKERVKPTLYYNKYVVSLKRIENKVVQGKILLQIPKDSASKIMDIGDTYTAFAKIKPISKPLNPNQFDYAKHLSKQYIYHQISILNDQLIITHKTQWSIFRLADQFRQYINLQLVEYSFTTKQLSIINALLLGQRQDIDQETFSEYRDAGAIHILAVSGLHVGIILLILNFILKPLDRGKQQGKTFKLILTILLLWCFAIIAGLSPSVLRAVTMFSFLAIGIQIRSKTSIYNSLFISIFILLCFNPLLLFSVGFQLSYLAVFAIVWVQPILAKRYSPRFYLTKKVWETFTVTIAAQLGLLPLTLFYFHQFPLLFFVSNVLIIPFLGGILGYGILVIILASIGVLPQTIASLFGHCIDLMNTIIGWIAQQEDFLITDIPFSWRMLIILYLIIILLVILFQKYKQQRLYWLGASITAMIFVMIYEKHTATQLQELILFQNQRNTILGILEDQRLYIYSKDSISNKTQHFLFENYLTQNQASLDISFTPLKNAYRYKEHTILIIDSTSIYTIMGVKPDIIILSNSPKIHLNRVIDSLHPKQIVVDGSNYKSYIDKWEASCRKQEIPFHRTDKKGAFILK
ncbi:ComEC/Rec2 family competence protein [Aquimarina sp. 2304DJ70-9]|uniref:ComEC/Rec2 family competence protein n=1 Tax=Aquimarina penaris TaxID=3231044 RepID=UPI00346321DF